MGQGKWPAGRLEVLNELQETFELTIGSPRKFIGINLKMSTGEIQLDMENYVLGVKDVMWCKCDLIDAQQSM